jgi:CrcB protein
VDPLQKYLFIAIGGALGAIARYAVGATIAERFHTRLPLGTLLVNITACFLIGLSIEYLNTHVGINPAWRYMIPIGFIGAYSTFSTFEWEIWTNVTSGAFWVALSYLLLSLVLGFVAVGLGAATARSLA